ncbi:hypothetical protein JTE90_021277 [Oedothorax gibbosus]|uniref:Nucleotide exchange factor SIL1 n=1 Tax=Oedothorax gibbosus TaxID=931172 RepID=A0AAV6U7T6_9ARAC|nr:hypothetical protein JTE90_021277 [Oedothorax gibbosus]
MNSLQKPSNFIKPALKSLLNHHRTKVGGKDPEYRRSLIKKIEFKTHSMALRKILDTLKNCTDEEMVPILENLKLLVHEYDIAINFMNVGGLELIVPFAQMDNEDIASAALSVLSAAMQGNPVVQKLVADNHVLDILLENLVDKNQKYFSSLLFTISSYLRNMPESQLHFFRDDGIFFLALIIESNDSHKLKLHSISILADLAMEIMDGSNINYQKMQLIKLFITGVQSTNVCKEITSFLNDNNNITNLDVIQLQYLIHEKIIHAMHALHKVCSREFQSNRVKIAIEKLIKNYDPQVKNTLYSKLDDELRTDIYLQLKNIYEKIVLKEKDEL